MFVVLLSSGRGDSGSTNSEDLPSDLIVTWVGLAPTGEELSEGGVTATNNKTIGRLRNSVCNRMKSEGGTQLNPNTGASTSRTVNG